MKYRIPFSKPYVSAEALDYVSQSLESGEIGGEGPYTSLCHSFLENRYGAGKALLTTSCTAALEMSALLCGIGPGDEVILPSYTFVSTANAFALRGCSLKFVDIRADTLNMDETKIEELITKRTKLIVPVHYGGVACEMDAIMSVANEHNIRVIEDAAQGIQARYKGRHLGTIGHLGAYSFHETKNISCGEGGALLVNDMSFSEQSEILREKGTNRSQFLRGQVDKYTWVDVGSSYLPADLLAAVLYAQLMSAETIFEARKKVYKIYLERLADLEKQGIIQLPVIPKECDSNFHIFYFLVENNTLRGKLLSYLTAQGIQATFHYVPLHSSPMGKVLVDSERPLPNTEHLSARLVRLPLYADMSEIEAQQVTDAVIKFFVAEGVFSNSNSAVGNSVDNEVPVY